MHEILGFLKHVFVVVKCDLILFLTVKWNCNNEEVVRYKVLFYMKIVKVEREWQRINNREGIHSRLSMANHQILLFLQVMGLERRFIRQNR